MRKNSTPPKTKLTKLKEVQTKLKEVQTNNVVRMPNVFDPEQVNQRLYKQVSVLLRQLEDDDPEEGMITIRERIAGLIAIGRIQQLFITMRKATGDVGAGSTVQKFAAAFTAPNAIGGRTADPRTSGSDYERSDWFEDAERANDDDDGGDAAA